MRLKRYIFYVDDHVNSGNGRLRQSSVKTSLDLLEQHLHTFPSNSEYVFGSIRRDHLRKGWKSAAVTFKKSSTTSFIFI